MLHNRLGRVYFYLWCTCLLFSYKNCLLKYKLMSYPFRVQFDRRGRGGGRSGPGGKEWAGEKGVGRGGRSRPGRIGLLYVIYPYFQDFLFDFLKRFQETEPFHFRSSSIIDYSDILAIHYRRLKFLLTQSFYVSLFFFTDQILKLKQ